MRFGHDIFELNKNKAAVIPLFLYSLFSLLIVLINIAWPLCSHRASVVFKLVFDNIQVHGTRSVKFLKCYAFGVRYAYCGNAINIFTQYEMFWARIDLKYVKGIVPTPHIHKLKRKCSLLSFRFEIISHLESMSIV